MNYSDTVERVMSLLKEKKVCSSSKKSHRDCYESLGAYLKQNNLPWALYSDSRTALSWLRKGKAQTKLELTPQNAELFDMLQKAEQWLARNTYTTSVYKWDTEHWGEIPADFGRK